MFLEWMKVEGSIEWGDSSNSSEQLVVTYLQTGLLHSVNINFLILFGRMKVIYRMREQP